jgi:hypothetical protein
VTGTHELQPSRVQLTVCTLAGPFGEIARNDDVPTGTGRDGLWVGRACGSYVIARLSTENDNGVEVNQGGEGDWKIPADGRTEYIVAADVVRPVCLQYVRRCACHINLIAEGAPCTLSVATETDAITLVPDTTIPVARTLFEF